MAKSLSFVTVLMGCIGLAMVGTTDVIGVDQPAKGKQASSLQCGDANQDGVLTADEAAAYWERRFQEMDRNGDGKLSSDEYATGRPKALENLDANKDGIIQVDEYVIYWCGQAGSGQVSGTKGEPGAGEAQFQKMDADKNGKVTPNECLVFYTARFHEIDGNGDGALSREEIAADTAKRFDMIDFNRDGSVTVGEYRTYWIKPEKGAAK